jgi:16S rRNA (guanine527-N7)-methyltransferase
MVTRRPLRDTSDSGSFCETLIAAAESIGRPLSDAEVRAFETHYRLLRHWGRRINLTGLRDRNAIIRRHFLEPIAVADILDRPGTLLDLGSGSGFPAIPLKVLRPELSLIMVESSERRSSFLQAVVRESRLTDVRVETRRVRSVDDVADLLPCRYISFRAIRVREILGKGSPQQILEPGGRVLMFLSAGQLDDVERIGLPGLNVVQSRRIEASPGAFVAVLESES